MLVTFINYLYLKHNIIASVDSVGLLERKTFHFNLEAESSLSSPIAHLPFTFFSVYSVYMILVSSQDQILI